MHSRTHNCALKSTKMVYKLILATLTISSLIKFGTSLTCYVCTSDLAACRDPVSEATTMPTKVCENEEYPYVAGFSKMDENFRKTFMPDLRVNTTQVPSDTKAWFYDCVKVDGTSTDGSLSGTVRSCVRKNLQNLDFCDSLDGSGVVKIDFCESCHSDLCNSSSKLMPSVILSIVVFVKFFFV